MSAHFFSVRESVDYASVTKKFVNTLLTKEKNAEKELRSLADKAGKLSYKELFSEKPEYYENIFVRKGLVFLIFENDTLRFWTDNTVAVDNLLSRNNFNNKIVKLPDGWFAVKKLSVSKKELFALILLKREYAYQNNYLADEFQRDFNIGGDIEIKIDTDKIRRISNAGGNIDNGDVYEAKGNYLCTLIFSHIHPGSYNPFVFYFAVFLNIFGFIFTLWFLKAEVDSQAEKTGRAWSVLLLMITVGALRYLTLQIKFPQQFYETKLFSPEIYGDASSIWLGSLGNLLINALLIFYLISYFCRIFPNIRKLKENNIYGYGHRNVTDTGFFPVSAHNNRFSFMGWSALLLILFFTSRIVNYIFSGIISNSNIPFMLNDIFSQNIYTFIGLAIIGLLFISYFLLLDKLVCAFKTRTHERKKYFILSSSAVVLFLGGSFFLGSTDFVFALWPVFIFITLSLIKQNNSSYSFTAIVILLFVVSFFAADLILKFTGYKEHETRKVFAQKLSAEQDPLAEHLFTEAEDSISTDTSLINLFISMSRNTAVQHGLQTIAAADELFKRELVAKYFSGYWEKYEIHIAVFDTSCYSLIPGSLPEKNNLTYFEKLISSEGTPTESNNLFYLQNSSGRISYLARIPLILTRDISARIGDLFIEFDSRIISEEAGFPELMLDRKMSVETIIGKDYSYGKYKNGKLISYHGNFPYSLYAENFLPDSSNRGIFPHVYFFETNGYNHLSYMADYASLIVVSKKEDGTIASITIFSYLFAFFSLMLLLLLLLRLLVIPSTRDKIHNYSFSGRIQFTLVSVVLFSLLFFGAGTIFYIQQQHNQQTRQNVRDKAISALVEATQEFGSESELKISKADFFSYILKRMSNIFLSDINLYDLKGNLVASSQKKLFDEGLLSHKMNPESYYRLVLKQDMEFIQEEKIGRLKYLSAYCSLRNNSGNLLGYLNIPYFARQSDLEKEISTVLSAIINIYVLLFVISIIITLALSEYFTRPLKLIQEKLHKVQLGKASEPIEWKSQDEIGSLVNEYNRTIDELQKSAALLAKSEREMAWREMAKQVAHEIKNPLTPMKLSIQHLQRIWKNKGDNMDEKIERLTQTLVEQIETLSAIASEFANFAKMPVTVNEKINLISVLENSLALFKDSTDTELTFTSSMSEAFIFADKEQMLRVCNNLLKNALQAIPQGRQGKIDVSVSKKNDTILIKVKDNGTGISGDRTNKIFMPNFTTKSGGMGLGLAIVKSIVETFSGKIWFETSIGTGTIFFISLPEYPISE